MADRPDPHLDRLLAEIGVIASQPARITPIAACYAPAQWKPKHPDEQPPF